MQTWSYYFGIPKGGKNFFKDLIMQKISLQKIGFTISSIKLAKYMHLIMQTFNWFNFVYFYSLSEMAWQMV